MVKPKASGDTWVHLDDGTTWPLPGAKLDAIGWRLRYGQPSKSDLLTVADLIGAWQTLIAHPSRRRSEVVRAIREEWERRIEATPPTKDEDDHSARGRGK